MVKDLRCLVVRWKLEEVRGHALVALKGRTPDYQNEFKGILDEEIKV